MSLQSTEAGVKSCIATFSEASRHEETTISSSSGLNSSGADVREGHRWSPSSYTPLMRRYQEQGRLTTQIGALPFVDVDRAVAYSLEHDIPFLPAPA